MFVSNTLSFKLHSTPEVALTLKKVGNPLSTSKNTTKSLSWVKYWILQDIFYKDILTLNESLLDFIYEAEHCNVEQSMA